jgi:hypothetical protein
MYLPVGGRNCLMTISSVSFPSLFKKGTISTATKYLILKGSERLVVPFYPFIYPPSTIAFPWVVLSKVSHFYYSFMSMDNEK